MHRSGRLVALVAALALVGTGGVLAQDEEAPPPGSATTIVPAGEDPLGVTYGEWGARWWDWLLSVPAAEGPASTDNCQANQGGEVFIVPHTDPGTVVTVNCEISPDQWLLLSPGSTVWGFEEGQTDEELRAQLEELRGVFSNLALSIDGVDVPDIDSYWVISPAWEEEYVEGNIFEAEAGSSERLMVAGWFMVAPPLEPGSHTIVVRDDVDIPDDDEGPLTAELTANITVPEAG